MNKKTLVKNALKELLQEQLTDYLELASTENKRFASKIGILNDEIKDLTWRLHAVCNYLEVSVVKVEPSSRLNTPFYNLVGTSHDYKVIPKHLLVVEENELKFTPAHDVGTDK